MTRGRKKKEKIEEEPTKEEMGVEDLEEESNGEGIGGEEEDTYR